MNAVETLRKAAEKLRGLAGAATDGPWWRSGSSIETAHECSPQHDCLPVANTYAGPTQGEERRRARLATEVADAQYIAAMHPGVGLALADWLEDAALYAIDTGADDEQALAVARVVLGEAP